MNARLLILVALAAIVGVVLLMRKPTAPATVEVANDNSETDDGLTQAERERIRITQQTLAQRDLPGVEPADPATLSVQIEVDRGSGKNRLCLYITEAQGYYVETFELQIWYAGDDKETTYGASPLRFTHYANKYLKANDTLTECIEVVPAELSKIGGGMGESEDWRAEIVRYGRARLENPSPLPPL